MAWLETSLKNDFWGSHGFPSYSDHSVSEETKLAVIKKMGYVSELIEFHSWVEIISQWKRGGDCADLAPGSIKFAYTPEQITCKSSSLKIQLWTEWSGNIAGCEIPAIPTISESFWIRYPSEKTAEAWSEFHDRLTEKLRSIESKLVAVEWFFLNDNFENFTPPSESGDKGWSFQGKPVSFHRVQFGWNGSQWGTLWYFVDRSVSS